MVNVELIDNVFTRVISKHYSWKCGKGALNKQVLSTFNDFRRETMGWNHEKALYVTNKGEIVWDKEGDSSELDLDIREAWKQSQEHGLLHLEHNHPVINGLENFPSTLSQSDIGKLLSSTGDGFLFRSVTAEYGESRMTISKSRDFKGGIVQEDWKHLNISYENAVSEYLFMYRDTIMGKIGMSKGEFMGSFNTDSSWGSDDYRDAITKESLHEIGSLQSFLEEKGVVDEFDKYGLVLKITGEV